MNEETFRIFAAKIYQALAKNFLWIFFLGKLFDLSVALRMYNKQVTLSTKKIDVSSYKMALKKLMTKISIVFNVTDRINFLN